MGKPFRFVPRPEEWARLVADAIDTRDPSVLGLLQDRSIDRERQLEDWLSDLELTPGPSGGAVPWVIVAASNAPQAWKDAATYVCDGVGDEVEINDAGGLLTALVVLSPGNFRLSDALLVGCRVVGQGIGVTYIDRVSGDTGWTTGAALVWLIGHGSSIEHVSIGTINPGPYHQVNLTGAAVLRDCHVIPNPSGSAPILGLPGATAVICHDTTSTVRSCYIGREGTGTSVTPAGTGVWLGYGGTVIDTTLEGLASGVRTDTLGGDPSLVTGCRFIRCGVGANFDSARRASITGNLFWGTKGSAVRLTGSTGSSSNADCVIANNLIIDANWSQTGDPIIYVSNGKRHRIHGNTARVTASGRRASHGVQLANTGCVNCWVSENDFLDAWTVAAVGDGGVGNTIGTNR